VDIGALTRSGALEQYPVQTFATRERVNKCQRIVGAWVRRCA